MEWTSARPALGSTRAREACAVVATLATSLSDAFAPLAELWLPTLLKVVALTVQVIVAAGDAALRAIVLATPRGFPRRATSQLPPRHTCVVPPSKAGQ